MPIDKFKDLRNFSKDSKPVEKKVTEVISFPGYKHPGTIDSMSPKDHTGYRFTSKEEEFRTKNGEC